MKNIIGIVLAAGYSSRMGSFKMGVTIGGVPMIERTVLNIQDVCDTVIVVGGYKIDIIRDVLIGYNKVKIIENDQYEKGMFSSIRAGLKATDGERFFIQPGDIPFISKNVFSSLLKYNSDVLIPVYKGRKGHPVLINRDIKDRILSEPIESKLNELLNKYGFKTVDIFEDSIHFDIDNIKDLKDLEKKFCKIGEKK